MERLLFKNGNVWDGESDQSHAADVLITDSRIEAVSRDRQEFSSVDALTIDATGATLIPGLVEAHGHISFPDVTYPFAINDTPPEETLLATMHNARTMLDAGFTTVVGAGSPKLRTEVVIRNEIESGRIPGPRFYASTPTLTVTGGLNDEGQMHQQRSLTGLVVDGVDEVRKAVRLCYREGVDLVKLNISGDDYFPRPPGHVTTMSEAEVAMAVEVAHALELYVVAHARSAESIKIAVRCGVDLVHHADFADEEALDLLESAKDRVIVTPTIGYLHGLMYESEAFGFDRAMRERMKLEQHMESNIATHTELRKRGLRAAIGGDYGLPMLPHGSNARDIEHLINYFGYSPVAALRCATKNGGDIRHRGHELGQIKPGYLADVLLVKGDPLTDVTLLQERANFLAIVKNGQLYKSP